jgi:hypothetical protein
MSCSISHADHLHRGITERVTIKDSGSHSSNFRYGLGQPKASDTVLGQRRILPDLPDSLMMQNWRPYTGSGPSLSSEKQQNKNTIQKTSIN